MHYQRWYRYGDPLVQKRIHGNDEDRFWSKVNKSGPEGCWLWTGTPGRLGYAQIRMGGRDGRMILVHRWAYESVFGPIPEGLQLDHVCHTRSETCEGGASCPHRVCVNPEHLEPVTARENSIRSNGPSGINSRKTHCDKGHPFDAENTYQSRGGRICRTCRLDHLRQWRQRMASMKTA